MNRKVLLKLFLLFISFGALAQQDPMFTKYMFNSLVYNPAYAGSKDHLQFGLIGRQQWVGFGQGAPSSQTFTVHSPLRNERVGVGFYLLNDKLGATQETSAALSYSYRIPVGKGKLCIGLQGGLMNFRANWGALNIQDPNDPSFATTPDSRWLPNFGAGIHYYSKYFFVGLGVPNLVEHKLRTIGDTELYARRFRHYYLTSGAAIKLNGNDLIFRPILMVRNVGLLSNFYKESAYQNLSAPTEFDIDLSLLFYEQFWIGAAFRSSIQAFSKTKSSSYDSVDLWFSYFMNNGLRIGLAYDYPLTKLQTVSNGSIELMIGYEMNFKTKKIVTPRYF